ncbi:anhydro-N-acetylmuramic acid kinase-like [Bradysia coprophila]|uniref:anhydro-N-acetylmuramic acid kinase-like n=1 Tax=Bradysia coprophila TaxID=38358 RepID=UPI00187DA409|nr:anhydro-N-acetylmuramic acid kinase-like [Bradysia coprophila]
MDYYVGIISGTSMDAIDAVLVDYSTMPGKIIATCSEPMPDDIRSDFGLLQLVPSNPFTFLLLGKLEVQIGKAFAQTVNKLLQATNLQKVHIKAIGSHGQTVWHQPDGENPFTIQIGDPNIIAEETGITTVADFRRRDMAVGGQGAPFAPVFHEALFRNAAEDRIVLNLGGIANISVLPKNLEKPITGFDTGPANTLSDLWTQKYLSKSFDENGHWAASGCINEGLLKLMLKDPYFDRPNPKSTGREYFNFVWIDKNLQSFNTSVKPADVQATLVELTALTVLKGIQQCGLTSGSLYVCGGGAKNCHLMERIRYHVATFKILSTCELGIPAEWMEALAFAWFAKNTINGQSVNLTNVTGARKAVILGGIYQS